MVLLQPRERYFRGFPLGCLADSACNAVAIGKNSDETPKFVALIEGDGRVVLAMARPAN